MREWEFGEAELVNGEEIAAQFEVDWKNLKGKIREKCFKICISQFIFFSLFTFSSVKTLRKPIFNRPHSRGLPASAKVIEVALEGIMAKNGPVL